MSAEPYDWNLVVVGAWNEAILTPAYMAEHLFGLAQDAPLEVLIQMDRRAPLRVKCQDLIVTSSSSRLLITPQETTAGTMQRAGVIAGKALTSLPRTPVSAAGINVRFKVGDAPTRLLKTLASTWDGDLADAGYEVSGRFVSRSLAWNGGVANVEVLEEGADDVAVRLNFHRESTNHADLIEWCNLAGDAVAEAWKVLATVGVNERAEQ